MILIVRLCLSLTTCENVNIPLSPDVTTQYQCHLFAQQTLATYLQEHPSYTFGGKMWCVPANRLGRFA